MPLVQTTIFPEPIDVPEDEVEILRAQGLLTEATTRAPAEGERRYPLTEVPDQTPKADDSAGAKPGSEEKK